MADQIFEHPRLAAVYDALDPDRRDLELYLGVATEFAVRSVLDVGCGTGVLALLLAERGLTVTGVDPAAASLDVARAKPGADRVRWVHGTAVDLPAAQADLAVTTGNAVQAVVDDTDWAATLDAVHERLRPGGHYVFETRDPARRAWEEWTDDGHPVSADIPGVGRVEQWTELLDVSLPLVTFRATTRFHADGAELLSDSTLRFRDGDEVAADLHDHGFDVVDVRDAPDRPGRELVFLARRR